MSEENEDEISSEIDEYVPSLREVALSEYQRSKKKQRHYQTKASIRTVIDMASIGMPLENIAAVLSISKKTLMKHYRHELDTAFSIANAQVGGKLFSRAMAGDTAALIFWAKTRMGWKEGIDVNVGGQEKNPLKMVFEVVPIAAAQIGQDSARNDSSLLSNDRSEPS